MLALPIAALLAIPARPAPTPPRDTLALTLDVRQVALDTTPAVALRLTFRPRSDTTTLALPDVWAGRRDLYRNVERLATSTPGARLDDGDGPARRVLHAKAGQPVTVEWWLRGARTIVPVRDGHNHTAISAEWAQLVGHDAFVLPASGEETAVRARLVFHGVPAGAVVATSYGTGRAPADTIVVARTTLGDLRHAVYTVAATPTALRLRNAGTPGHAVHVVVRDSLAMSDATLAAAVRRVMATEREFWRDAGPPDYLVTIGTAPGGSLAGMRVTNAFIADLDPARTFDGGVTVLLAHELMHDWIGTVLRPSAELPDGALAWFTEGVTEYLSHRVPWRAGLLTDSAYVAFVDRALREHATSPARDLPWSDVVARYWSDLAAQRQPYLRGELLALRLDALLRAAPAPRSFDDVLRGLMADEHRSAAPMTEERFVAALARTLGDSVAHREVRAMLDGGPIVLPPDALGGCVDSRIDAQALWDPGFDFEASFAARRVQGVRAGGAAERAGLRDGQTITGANVFRGDVTKPIMLRVRADSVEQRISYPSASDRTVEVQALTWRAGCVGR